MQLLKKPVNIFFNRAFKSTMLKNQIKHLIIIILCHIIHKYLKTMRLKMHIFDNFDILFPHILGSVSAKNF